MANTTSSANVANAGNTGPISYAQALNDAKHMIVQQSNRIRSDAEKLKAQAQEIAQLRTVAAAANAEAERLSGVESQLADAWAAKEQAEAAVGRQRVEIDSLQAAAREMQRVLGQQAERINDLTRELESMSERLPTDDDASALAAMAALLATTKTAKAASAQQPSHAQQQQSAAAPASRRAAAAAEEQADLRVVEDRAASPADDAVAEADDASAFRFAEGQIDVQERQAA